MKNEDIILPDELSYLDNWFWDIISEANHDIKKLKEILWNMEKEDIYHFQEIYLDAAGELRDEPFTNFMEESEDGIEDISYWVVSKGKAYYAEIINSPEKIPYSVDGRLESNFVYLASEVYQEKYNERLDLY
ncbi:DUF4240 domain-containing protein [Flavobacterium ginsenosidimutans]|uniref:DUF4240 domain-containing protein n=1 Tax=Flavobacterium ginsenosidimutans TaxID=687844 RepID=UPI003D99F639